MLNFFQFSSTATKTTLSNDQTLREHLNDFMNQVGGQARAISNKHKFGKKKKFNPQSLPDSSKKPKGESGNLTFRETRRLKVENFAYYVKKSVETID